MGFQAKSSVGNAFLQLKRSVAVELQELLRVLCRACRVLQEQLGRGARACREADGAAGISLGSCCCSPSMFGYSAARPAFISSMPCLKCHHVDCYVSGFLELVFCLFCLLLG